MDKLGQLSKYDIKNEESTGGLKIYPFTESCLKGASYDLTPTIIAMSVEFGMLEKVYREKVYPYKHYIYVKPKSFIWRKSGCCKKFEFAILMYERQSIKTVICLEGLALWGGMR